MIDVAYLALGSNVGDRLAHLARARAALAGLPYSHLVGESSIEETLPLGDLDQDPYLNQMVALKTGLAPHELLARLQDIEAAEGRVRPPGSHWAPRTMDIDIVCFERQTVHDPDLHVPHRELPNRAFWQRELAELQAPSSGGDE